MVPLQYFLVLLALLSAMGCTQKAPPGSIELTKNSNKMNPMPAPSPDETVTVSPDGKPSEPVSTPHTSLELDTSGGDQNWKITLKGYEAEMLYQLLEVKSVEKTDADGKKYSEKQSTTFNCSKAEDAFQCALQFNSVTGELPVRVKKEELVIAAAELDLKKNYVGILVLDALAEGKTTKTARLIIPAESAKKIFNALNVTPKEGEKKGTHIKCSELFCKSFFTYSDGQFEIIQ